MKNTMANNSNNIFKNFLLKTILLTALTISNPVAGMAKMGAMSSADGMISSKPSHTSVEPPFVAMMNSWLSFVQANRESYGGMLEMNCSERLFSDLHPFMMRMDLHHISTAPAYGGDLMLAWLRFVDTRKLSSNRLLRMGSPRYTVHFLDLYTQPDQTVPTLTITDEVGAFLGMRGYSDLVQLSEDYGRPDSWVIAHTWNQRGEALFAPAGMLLLDAGPYLRTIARIYGAVVPMYHPLLSICVPDSVRSIAIDCFGNLDSLVAVLLPDTLTHLGHSCFQNCSALAQITLPRGLQQIGNAVFLGCVSLRSIYIPGGVVTVGERCFWGCRSLVSVVIAGRNVALAGWTFCLCDSLQNVSTSLPGGDDSFRTIFRGSPFPQD